MTGYSHPAYAAALAELGTPRRLPQSEGWILVRPIPCPSGLAHLGLTDAMGCYPVFSCADWSRLGRDLETLETNIVSLIVVTDPFGTYSEPQLHEFFPDLARPFKEHFVVDLREPMKQRVSSHHQRNVARANRQVVVERCPELAAWEEETWRRSSREVI